MNYRIEYLGFGFTAWQGYKIENVDEYDDKEDIPTFNTEDAPITEGLKLLEKGGKIKIVDLDNDEVEDTSDEPADDDTEETADEPADDIEDTSDEPTDEVESTAEVETSTVELEGTEADLTVEDLKDTFTSDELDGVCKKYDISGYSKLNKTEKAELIVSELE